MSHLNQIKRIVKGNLIMKVIYLPCSDFLPLTLHLF